mgnify:FL=1
MSESCVTYHCPDCIFTSTNEDGTGYYEIICDVCIKNGNIHDYQLKHDEQFYWECGKCASRKQYENDKLWVRE